MARQRAARRQFVGKDGRMILEFCSRYARPQDDMTVMNVFHRTTDGGVSVLLEREDIRPLANWFAGTKPFLAPVTLMELDGTQTRAVFKDYGPTVGVTVAWKGSGRARSVTLSGEDRRAVAAWLDHIDRNGWEGWKSGVVS